jgi:uncharacterized membrane protein YphA (DoxX/SURF4 family)
MESIKILLQLLVAFGLLNVWLIRCHQKTPYRGSNARSLKDEFTAYGLPVWSFYVIGFLKITSALLLLVGLWKPFVVFPAALIVVFLMGGAIAMHIKVADSFNKFIPAIIMLFLSSVLCLLSY